MRGDVMIEIISIMIVTFVLLLIIDPPTREKREKRMLTPRKAEYIAAYPERIENETVACECGSTKLFATGTPSGNFDTFILCVCKSCRKILYTTSANDKNPTKAEGVV